MHVVLPIVLSGLLALASAAATSPRSALAADCAGITIKKLTLTKKAVQMKVTVAAPDLTHAGLAATAEAISLSVVDPDDAGRVLYTSTTPIDQFVSSAKTTKFKDGATKSSLVLKNSKKRAGTVIVTAKLPLETAVAKTDAPRRVRVHLSTSDMCARSCLSRCKFKKGKLRCKPGLAYDATRTGGRRCSRW